MHSINHKAFSIHKANSSSGVCAYKWIPKDYKPTTNPYPPIKIQKVLIKMCAKFVCVVLVASFVCGALALPSQDSSERDLVNLINKLDNEDSVPLFGGMRIDRTETGRSFGSAKAIESFEDRAERYLETHELNLSFSGDEQEENAENVYSGRAMEGK